MKKFIYTLGVVAAAAFTFSACQKEQSIKDEPSDKLVTITFTAEKAGVDTKTAAVEGTDEVSFVWTDEDVANIKLFEVGEDSDGKEVLTVVANPVVTKESETKLTISASVAPGNHVFRAVLSGAWTNDGKKPRLSDSQSPLSGNFDPNADVLISDEKEVTLAESGEATCPTGDLLMVFRRQIVVNKMTLKNLTEGESISKIVISSNKNLAGYFNYKDPRVSGDKTSLVLNYGSASVPEGGQFPVYFTTLPGTGHILTVEVTTDQHIYTKSFAEGKSIDFNLGQFTKFNLALPEGDANTALSLPVKDDMDWATTGTIDATAELGAADLTATQNGKKIYSSAQKVYKGTDGLKFGSSKETGSITTNEIDLSSSFYVAIDAKAFTKSSGALEESYLKVQIDGTEVYSGLLKATYDTYFVNCQAVTAKSTVTISITGGRGYITNLVIGSGTYVAPPAIVVSSDNPMSVSNANERNTIEYSISNPTEGVSISASSNAAWIHSFDYTTEGEISFEVDAQEAGAPERSGEITLEYPGANSVKVVVNQAPGAGGVTYYFVPLEEAPSDWTAETYIIVSNNSVLNATKTSSWGGITSVTKESDGSIKSNEDIEACEIAVSGDATNGYYLKFVNGTAYYIVLQTSNNFALNTDKPTSTIGLYVDSIKGFTSSTAARNLRLNGTSGFRWYGNTTGTAAVLYKKVGK